MLMKWDLYFFLFPYMGEWWKEGENMEELTRIADALERIADKLDMLAETGEEIEQDLNTLAECTGYIAPPVYAPAEAKGAHYLRIGGSVDAG